MNGIKNSVHYMWREQGKLVKKAGNLFATAYLLLLFCVYPFYMEDGYVDIGESKYHFLICSSLAALLILAALAVVDGIGRMWKRYKEKEAYLIWWDKIQISATDLFVGLFAAMAVISTVFSDFPREALCGTEGWRIGLVLLLALCGLYFLVSRLWVPSPFLWYAAMAASGVVFLLGILDRFSIYLIPISIRDPAFISTLGNINWFCGYLSVLTPIGACIFMFAEKQRLRILSAAYLFVAFTAGFCQGSNSVFLFWAALFFLLLWIGVSKKESFGRLFFMAGLWCFCARIVGILRVWFPESYNYDPGDFCLFLIGSHLTVAAAFFLFLTGLLLKWGRKRDPDMSRDCRGIRRILAGIPAAVLLIVAILVFFNTQFGIPGLTENAFFRFGNGWGNGRGAAWKAGIDVFARMGSVQKVIGAGPDCFSAYAYSEPQTAGMLRDYFGSSRLTNAHNELLTSLVNIGVAGTFFYFGIFISGILRGLGRAEREPYLMIPAACVFCYLIHNMVSFAQVLNLPYVFLIVAMGEAMHRKISNFIDKKH